MVYNKLILGFSSGVMNQDQVKEVAVDFFVGITPNLVKEERWAVITTFKKVFSSFWKTCLT